MTLVAESAAQTPGPTPARASVPPDWLPVAAALGVSAILLWIAG